MVVELEVEDDILPCPFCGKKPQRLHGIENDKYWIWCNNGDCLIQPSSPLYRNEGSDIEAWNKRRTIN